MEKELNVSLSNKSWHAQLYKWVYQVPSTHEKSLCPYFWKVIWAILIADIVLISRVFLGENRNPFTNTKDLLITALGVFLIIMTIGIDVGLLLVGFSFGTVVDTKLFHDYTRLILPSMASALTALFLFAMLLERIIEKVKERNRNKIKDNPEGENLKDGILTIVSVYMQGVFRKICPSITWHKEETE